MVEWICLEFGGAAGEGALFPDTALVGMPDRMVPTLVVERFDIRRDAADQRRLALEDFGSVLDLPASAKYNGTIESASRACFSHCPPIPPPILLRDEREAFAWAMPGRSGMRFNNSNDCHEF